MIEKVHWLGQSAFRINSEKIIYFDPWRIKGGEKADVILITHAHTDHYSPQDIKKIAKPGTVLVGPKKVSAVQGCELKTMAPGEKISISGIEIESVPSYNINKFFHPRKDDNTGFIVTVENTRIYHAGDTDFIPEMRDIKADICLLPIGGTFTMNAEEAAEAADMIRAKITVPMHWGNIVGTLKDAEKFKSLVKSCEVRILDIEE